MNKCELYSLLGAHHDTLVHDLVSIKQHFVTETIQAVRPVDLVELIEVVVQVAFLSIFFTVLLLIILPVDPSRISGVSVELLQPTNERAVASDTCASCKLLRIENDGRAGLDLARRKSRPVARMYSVGLLLMTFTIASPNDIRFVKLVHIASFFGPMMDDGAMDDGAGWCRLRTDNSMQCAACS